MEAETMLFIHSLFERCVSNPSPNFLTLTAIHPNGDRPTPSCHVALGNEQALETALERLQRANVKGWGAYFGVATRTRNLRRWARGGKSDLALLPALFVDIDDPDTALAHLAWFDLPPTSIVHSGRGYHAFWLLETPTTDFALADQIIHGLAQHLGGDTALSVAQSMRLVGTLNTKPGRDNAPCSLIRYFPERRYMLQDFARFKPEPVVHWYRPASGQGNVPDTSRQAIIDAVTDAVMHHLDGRPRGNGFIAARCPLPHLHDRPGMHFSYQPETGWGFCFGRHGKISLREMCALLGVAVAVA